MKFWELSIDEKMSIYLGYVGEMDNPENKGNILSFDEYCQEAEWDLSEENF